MANAWAKTKQASESKSESKEDGPVPVNHMEHYRSLYKRDRTHQAVIRMSAVGKENTAKTGFCLARMRDYLGPDKEIIILDFDGSAGSTVAFNFPTDENIRVIPLFDELDSSIFNEDNTTNWTALVDKTSYFLSCIGEDIQQGAPIGGVLMDGCSTFLKWCEFAMTDILMNRSKNPINVEDGDRFNQAEWRTRNKLFRDAMGRAHKLPLPAVCYTFHLKDVKEFMDIGDGKKGLMKVGEVPEWENGTKRLFSQQIFLARYNKKGDSASGVKADPSLDEGEWVIRATIEEMKGYHMDHLGETHDLLRVKDGKAHWLDLPFLVWNKEVAQKKAQKKAETKSETKSEEKSEEVVEDDSA
tara:strand:+ start:11811 stop:12878 length:1068 start_codon:yes stop_codon:yes gene_type:complete